MNFEDEFKKRMQDIFTPEAINWDHIWEILLALADGDSIKAAETLAYLKKKFEKKEVA